MKNKMILITIFLLVGFAISLPVFLITKNDILETVTITIGITLYHFVMRLAVGTTINFLMKNSADHNSVWFRPKRFESRLYNRIWVRKWKKYLPTYNPDTFDTTQKTVQELVGSTCQAEIVHEVIMVFSLFPIILIPFLGGAAALIITSVLAMLFDSVFVILQRYNRPKLVKVMGRFQKLKNGDARISQSDESNA